MTAVIVSRYAQRGVGRFTYQILNDTSSAASSRILVFPTAGFSPETSLEIGLRVFLLYYAKDDTVVNRLSEIVLYGFVTLRGQFGALLENAVYSNQNTYYLLGRVRYPQFPLLFYGIGPDSKPGNPALVNSNYVQIRLRALRKVIRNLYAGAEIDFQNLSGVSFEKVDAGFELLVGGQGSTTLELGAPCAATTSVGIATKTCWLPKPKYGGCRLGSANGGAVRSSAGWEPLHPRSANCGSIRFTGLLGAGRGFYSSRRKTCIFVPTSASRGKAPVSIFRSAKRFDPVSAV